MIFGQHAIMAYLGAKKHSRRDWSRSAGGGERRLWATEAIGKANRSRDRRSPAIIEVEEVLTGEKHDKDTEGVEDLLQKGASPGLT